MKLLNVLYLSLLAIFTDKIQAQSPILDSTVCINVGDIAQINVIANAMSIPSGNAGAAQIYDYSILPPFNSNYEIIGIDNLTSPYGTTFPNANATVSWSSFGTPYYHFQLSNTAYTYLGGGSSFGDYEYIDPYDQLRFPFSFNDTYTDDFWAISNTGGYRQGTVSVTGDGYGTLLVPSQTFNDILRVKRESEYYDTINGNPRCTQETYYEYYKPGMPHYILLHGFYNITTGSSNPVSGAQLFFNSGAVALGFPSNNAQSNYHISNCNNSWQLNVKNEVAYKTFVSIHNMQGQLLWQDKISITNENSSIILPLVDKANGLYLVQFTNLEGQTVCLKCNKVN